MFTNEQLPVIIEILRENGLIIAGVFSLAIFLIIKYKKIWVGILLFILILIFSAILVPTLHQNSNTVDNPKNKNTCHFKLTGITSHLSVRTEAKDLGSMNEIEKIFPPKENICILRTAKEVHKNNKKYIWYEISYKNGKNIQINGWVFGDYITSKYGKYHLKKNIPNIKVYSNTTKFSQINILQSTEKKVLVINTKFDSKTQIKWYEIQHADDNGIEIKGWVLGNKLEKEPI